ncbi:tyrosine-type recombinase/integrase [Thioclava atlantica]|uniref:Phage integrase n=1 Tax=Thioclava atlantica TaxID=1317124 RepID=A0A085U0R6_9RHOB|nr:integrase family protein [Thioclava atlantica]KFE36563.1 phage integrase [Thioclava atlantica]
MSRKVALTDCFIRNLKPQRAREEYSDTKQIGLRLRVSASGRITFAYRGRARDGKLRTVTIGDYPSWSLKGARNDAARIRMELKQGKDPNGEKRRLREDAAREKVTLRDVLDEYEAIKAGGQKIWRRPPRGRCEARLRIEAVFEKLLDRPVSEITEVDLAHAMRTYKPRRDRGKTTAHGQTSRARSYLARPLDWAAGRNTFKKIGAGRSPCVGTPDIRDTHDFSEDDPTITGKRERVLKGSELARILPYLRYPAPKELKLIDVSHDDLRPIAMRFILLTAARLHEVIDMHWRDVNFSSGTWFKPKVKAKGEARSQVLPLSNEAIKILSSLPGHNERDPDGYVFPNLEGGPLGNFSRANSAIMRESGTANWHRHDLRRTASQIMLECGAPPLIVDTILAHTNALTKTGASQSISHYGAVAKTIMLHVEDPQKSALEHVAKALNFYELLTPDQIKDLEEEEKALGR